MSPIIDYVWIVEMREAGEYVWRPTLGVGLGYKSARRTLSDWRKRRNNPGDRFRLGVYVRVVKSPPKLWKVP